MKALLQVNPNHFDIFLESYTAYLKSITRPQLFGPDGNYTPEVTIYHDKLRWYHRLGTYREQQMSGFLLGWI